MPPSTIVAPTGADRSPTGVIISGQVQCPWHGSQFDCRTGAVVNGPARDRIGTYAVEERAGQVILHLERQGQLRTEPTPVSIGR